MPTGVYLHKKGVKHPGLIQGGEKNHRWKGGLDKDKEYKRNYHREYNRRTRDATLAMLGNKCVRCDFSDKRALQIDHINAGGTKERKSRNESSTEFHKFVMKSLLAKENKYQLLCANCNWIKRHENGEHGGRKCAIII